MKAEFEANVNISLREYDRLRSIEYKWDNFKTMERNLYKVLKLGVPKIVSDVSEYNQACSFLWDFLRDNPHLKDAQK